MSMFRNAIADLGLTPSGYENDAIAEAVLEMPEMQAIKAWMNWSFERDGETVEPILPDSIIEWIVS